MSADAVVFVAACVMGTFALGLEVGAANVPPACPTVAGQQVVSTIDGRDGQVCVYAKAYGRATRRVRL
jgi:hypothetical protein